MPDLRPGVLSAGLSAGVAFAGCLLLLAKLSSVRRTTLVYPWLWTMVSLVTVAGVEIMAGLALWPHGSVRLEAYRYIATMSTFCPGIALLGAKRPQDTVWQSVVFSLWVILALPGVQTILLQHSALRIPGIESWFMLILLIVTAANSIPTRFWPSVILVLVSQWLLLGEYLPVGTPPSGTAFRLAGLCSGLLAIGLVAARFPKYRASANELDRLWTDFRNTYGMLWALRVSERINAAATHSGWNVSLTWNGFEFAELTVDASSAAPIPAAADTAAVSKTFRALLRRFVSKQWIAERKIQEYRPRHNIEAIHEVQ